MPLEETLEDIKNDLKKLLNNNDNDKLPAWLPELLLTPGQLADVLKISSQEVRRKIKTGKIKSVSHGPKEFELRVKYKDFIDYLKTLNNTDV
ncbi:MAG: helix-turn-helix domain-containing protein [Bacteroidales bacterium]|nr:helix-turn-helix domain-containing protein [Bacteroidales bacterium]